MTVPQLMVKVWTGEDGEFFTFRDMKRIQYNLNIMAEEIGVAQVDYMDTTRASQFRYDEAQRIEDHILAMATALGLSVATESAWGVGRTVTFVDFERWEAGTWAIYQALGGIGERIPSDRRLVTYRTTLFAGSWQGTGPYWMVIEMPGVYDATELMAFVPHTASVEQRRAEYNAVLRILPNGDRSVRFEALSIIPEVDIPMAVAIGGLQMHEEINLPASGWEGPDVGPWTQQVTLQGEAVDGVVGQWEGMSDEAVVQMMRGMLHVSGFNGRTATVRVIGARPSININPMMLYDVTEVE